MKKMKRIASVFLVMVMLLCVLPINAFAAENVAYVKMADGSIK